MELNYDWRNFQTFFYARKDKPPSSADAALASAAAVPGTIHLLVDQNQKKVIAAFSDGEDLTESNGTHYEDVIKAFPHREIVTYDQDKVDHLMSEAVHLPHAYDQIQFLRAQAKPQVISSGSGNSVSGGSSAARLMKEFAPAANHFLLRAIQGWWQKLLPSSYGIFIRLDGVHGRSLLMTMKRGRLDSFQVPDLSGMIPERRKYPADVTRHLSENYLVPVQGIFLTSEEWFQWSASPNPWPEVLKSLRAGKNKLNPFSWGVLFLIACRAYLGM